MDNRALIKEAQSPSTAAARLAELATSEDADVRRAVARNGALPEESLAKLLEDDSWEVRTVAAHHKKAPADKAEAVVTSLATATSAPRRAIAARSPKTPVELLVKLVDDTDIETRSNALRNPRTPREVVRAHLTETEPAVLLGVLSHPSIPNQERRAFLTEEFLMRFFETHADGDHLFEALCEKYLWEVLERAFLDPERMDDAWSDLVRAHFELIEIPSRNTVLAAVHRDHWPAMARRLAAEIHGGERKPD